jgi:3-phenylpropionate/trans-cinnamate dioxygenase ferredoxin reductase subunit
VSIVIVGGGPAAHSAARGYRDAGGEEPVRLITDDDRPPYQRPPLTKEFLRGESSEDDLPLGDVDGLEIVYATATRLDPDARVVEVDDGRRFVYSGCVLAPGATPVRLSVPGADDDRVHTLRFVRDVVGLGEPRRVIVIGTGFIGCEAAASLAMRGAEVTVIGMEDLPQESRLGRDAGQRLAQILRDLGVELRLGEEVERVDDLDADTILMATGVSPRIELAEAAGLRIDGGAIAADVALRTTAPNVYAAGDACAAQHPVAGRALRVEHWGDALTQGKIAGRRLAGEDVVWDSVPGFWSTIGNQTLKYAAWGDGYAGEELDEHGDAWTIWYYDEDGNVVGALCHDRDADYERAQQEMAG